MLPETLPQSSSNLPGHLNIDQMIVWDFLIFMLLENAHLYNIHGNIHDL